MANRGRHRKKNKMKSDTVSFVRVNLQELINLYCSGKMSMSDFQSKIENLPYEPRKT